VPPRVDIDFGHFLGHYKSKLGVARETTPFVFTDAQAQVLGGMSSPMFKTFKVFRTHATLHHFYRMKKARNLFFC
jgi:hypothetical protein